MNYSIFPVFFAGVLIFISPLSEAGINKCTDSNGVVSYSDQPCSTKEGQKPAEIKNATTISAFAKRENERKIGKTCLALSEKSNRCSIESNLKEAFNNNCEAPIQREYIERQREENSRANREERESERHDEIGEAKMSCGEVESAMWSFVKENFGAKLTAQEIKAIEYNLIGVPVTNGSSDSDSYNYGRKSKKRRNY